PVEPLPVPRSRRGWPKPHRGPRATPDSPDVSIRSQFAVSPAAFVAVPTDRNVPPIPCVLADRRDFPILVALATPGLPRRGARRATPAPPRFPVPFPPATCAGARAIAPFYRDLLDNEPTAARDASALPVAA